MSTATLNNLLEYLYGTLSADNMRWVGEHLIEHAKKEKSELKPYTIEEIHAMIDESEADIAAGRTISHEEMMRRWEEELAREEQLEMAEAV